MSIDAEVHGSRVPRRLIRHIKDAGGPRALEAIVEAAGPRAKAVFAKPIRVISWHPYDAYSSFLTAIDQKLGRGDLAYCRTLGAFAGARDLGTIFKIYVALASPERLIRSCAKVWSSYHRGAGEMRALSWEPAKTVLRIEGFPSMYKGHYLLMEELDDPHDGYDRMPRPSWGAGDDVLEQRWRVPRVHVLVGAEEGLTSHGERSQL